MTPIILHSNIFDKHCPKKSEQLINKKEVVCTICSAYFGVTFGKSLNNLDIYYKV